MKLPSKVEHKDHIFTDATEYTSFMVHPPAPPPELWGDVLVLKKCFKEIGVFFHFKEGESIWGDLPK